jgi:hypothetical protein
MEDRLIPDEELIDVAESLYNFRNAMDIKGIKSTLWQLVKRQDRISFKAGRKENMKLKSVKSLYFVKQSIIRLQPPEGVKKKIIEAINSVLLDEGGAKAVLFPYNSLEQQILCFWGEGMKPEDIAIKLSILDCEGNPDIDTVGSVLDTPPEEDALC